MALKLKVTGSGQMIDAQEVRRSLSILADPRHAIQLQAAPHWRYMTFDGADLDGMVAWCAQNSDATGIYYALNPVAAGLADRVKNADALYRRWLLVDIDRAKSDTNKELSATAAEHEQARLLTTDILEYLYGLDWPSPLMIDSGNGFHLLYLLDLPNSELGKVLVKAVLLHLAERWNDERGMVGAECHDARRISKLPGTWARRGPAQPDRPHRMARLLHAPDELRVVPQALLEGLTGTTREPGNGHASNNGTAEAHTPGGIRLKATSSGSSEHAYAQAALERECGRMAIALPGALNVQLYKSAAALGNFVGAGLLTESAAFDTLLRAARQAGCDDPQKDEDTIRRGLDKGKLEPRKVPEKKTGTGTSKQAEPEPLDPGERVTIQACKVETRKVSWLWPLRIPNGKLTTFAGLMGIGKTFLLCDVAARVSAGLPWPDLLTAPTEPGDVLFISGEDDPEDTLVPRLIECGANLSRVRFLSLKALEKFDLTKLDMLDRACAESLNLKLIVIDPPSSYLADKDEHKNAEVRQLLTPLKHWAAKRNVAVVFNTHLNKGGNGKVEAIFRVIGSIAWMAAVRAGHLIALDADDPEKRLFVPMKSNLGKKRPALAYTVKETTGELARVEWLGEIDITADQAMTKSGKPRKVIASEWMIEKFREKREWLSEDLFRMAAQENISRDAIFEAKSILQLPRARRNVGLGGAVSFVWWVPEDWPQLGQIPDSCPSCPSSDESAY